MTAIRSHRLRTIIWPRQSWTRWWPHPPRRWSPATLRGTRVHGGPGTRPSTRCGSNRAGLSSHDWRNMISKQHETCGTDANDRYWKGGRAETISIRSQTPTNLHKGKFMRNLPPSFGGCWTSHIAGQRRMTACCARRTTGTQASTSQKMAYRVMSISGMAI